MFLVLYFENLSYTADDNLANELNSAQETFIVYILHAKHVLIKCPQ